MFSTVAVAGGLLLCFRLAEDLSDLVDFLEVGLDFGRGLGCDDTDAVSDSRYSPGESGTAEVMRAADMEGE